ncbi:hypothetical protein PPERSA_03807 [Pseudocohnilembus persalinus]|uniref:Uncharacterized protein n=1 Tax=Pseudocohnilembus persalinus TaxID=266149 RepID=A0A0V0QUI1_PSEPJ|nr:hypothetical protein PPERSA_03807 [Pseudocohnilembus persalinus]|eukprot:KRX05870.1 hypothetical protein PPERSA_03807 [Pseudocohnilembus persalinus]
MEQIYERHSRQFKEPMKYERKIQEVKEKLEKNQNGQYIFYQKRWKILELEHYYRSKMVEIQTMDILKKENIQRYGVTQTYEIPADKLKQYIDKNYTFDNLEKQMEIYYLIEQLNKKLENLNQQIKDSQVIQTINNQYKQNQKQLQNDLFKRAEFIRNQNQIFSQQQNEEKKKKNQKNPNKKYKN